MTISSRCVVGLGRTQPGEWEDAGEVFGHPGLKGCVIPKGRFMESTEIVDDDLCLQFNEVRSRYSCCILFSRG